MLIVLLLVLLGIYVFTVYIYIYIASLIRCDELLSLFKTITCHISWKLGAVHKPIDAFVLLYRYPDQLVVFFFFCNLLHQWKDQ